MIKFGTGGWRAIIGDGFTKANVQILTRALAQIMKDEGKSENGICIGYDRRFLSLQSARWAAEVMAAENIHCRILDREAPTPLIMFTVNMYDLQYGMAITASHNPAIYNGIKIFTHGGRDADENVTNKIEQYIDKLKDIPVSIVDFDEAKNTGLVEEIDPFNEYIDSILAKVNIEAIMKSRMKITLDPMYGVSQTSLSTILMTLRCELLVIHERHDTLFGGRLPAPNASTLNKLSNYVSEYNCDLGIATDGDADRIGVIDNNGDFLHPNEILVLLYYYLMKYKGWRGPVVRNNSTTHILDRVAKDFGQECYEVPVGFKHISSKMTETDAIIGGESSGGLTVKGHIHGKDGIYAATFLVEMIAITGKSLSELYSEITDQYGSLYFTEQNFTLTPNLKEKLAYTLFTEKNLPTFNYPIEKISYMDGCKVYFENGGWIIARFSGTEPLIRLFCEMPNKEMAEDVCKTMSDYLDL